MKNAAVCDQIPVQLLRRDLGIRAGLAGKGKASLPGFGEFYECQRGKIAGIHQQRPGIHTDALERLRQKAPLEIVADLADKGGAAPQLCGAGQHIGRRAAGILLKDCHAGIGVRQRGVVDQNFAQRHNVCRLGGLLRRAMGNVVVHGFWMLLLPRKNQYHTNVVHGEFYISGCCKKNQDLPVFSGKSFTVFDTKISKMDLRKFCGGCSLYLNCCREVRREETWHAAFDRGG